MRHSLLSGEMLLVVVGEHVAQQGNCFRIGKMCVFWCDECGPGHALVATEDGVVGGVELHVVLDEVRDKVSGAILTPVYPLEDSIITSEFISHHFTAYSIYIPRSESQCCNSCTLSNRS